VYVLPLSPHLKPILASVKYNGNPGCYMQFVTRPLRDGKYLQVPRQHPRAF
jgi:hypothetical protein